MFILLFCCVESEPHEFTFEADMPSDTSESYPEPEQEIEAEPEQSQSTEPTIDPPEEEEEIIPEVTKTEEFLSDTATHQLIFEERQDASQAHLWNFPTNSDDGFFFHDHVFWISHNA